MRAVVVGRQVGATVDLDAVLDVRVLGKVGRDIIKAPTVATVERADCMQLRRGHACTFVRGPGSTSQDASIFPSLHMRPGKIRKLPGEI